MDPDAKTTPFMFRVELLQNDRVRYANQPIAVVIAETLEAATEGAALLAPRYDARSRPRRDLDVRRELRAAGRRHRQPPQPCLTAMSRPGFAAAAEAHRGDLRDAGAVPQRDGAARDRGRTGTATG